MNHEMKETRPGGTAGSGDIASGWHGRLELCWGTAHPADLTELVEAAAGAGIGAVSATPQLYFGARAAGRSDQLLRRQLSDNGVGITIVDPLLRDLPGSAPFDSLAPSDRPYFEFGEDDCYRMADALEIGTINVAHYLGSKVPVPSLTEAIGQLAQRARSRGLRVTIEFIPGTGIPDLGTAIEIVDGIGLDSVSVMFDTWHFHRAGGAVEDLVGLPAAAIGALQVSDVPASVDDGPYVPMSGRLFPGDGVQPLPELLTQLLDGRPELNVGVEVFGAVANALAPVDAARRARQSIEAVLFPER